MHERRGLETRAEAHMLAARTVFNLNLGRETTSTLQHTTRKRKRRGFLCLIVTHYARKLFLHVRVANRTD